jgi:anti-sigma regulatory factor (Ser/Thr protein kinase)
MTRAAITFLSGGVNPMIHRSPDVLALTVHSTLEWAAHRGSLRRWIADRSGAEAANDVLLASGEAVDNAFEHGRSPVTLESRYHADGKLEIVVRDRGSWRVSAQAPPRGLGLPIMTALMDNVTIDTTDGTALRLTRRLPARTEERSWTERSNPGRAQR